MDGLLPILIIFGIISFFSNMKKKEAEQKKKAQAARERQAASGHMQQQAAPAQEKADALTTLMKKIDPRFEGWEEYIPLEKKRQAHKPQKQPETAQMSTERDDATWRRTPISQSIESQIQSAVGTTHTLQTSVAPSRAEEKAKAAHAPQKAQAVQRPAAALSVHALARSGAGMLAEGFVLSEILGKPKALRR